MQIKENIKTPRHWPLCGDFTGTGEFPTQRASYAENVSIWWRHHVSAAQLCLWIASPFVQSTDCRLFDGKPIPGPSAGQLLDYIPNNEIKMPIFLWKKNQQLGMSSVNRWTFSLTSPCFHEPIERMMPVMIRIVVALKLISPWRKWPPFRRRQLQTHFHEWKVLYFDSNFIKSCSQLCNWQ